MKTAHKFILKAYLGPMILTFFIVMFVLVIQFIWRYIDELVGKGLDSSVILELMFYASATLIPMGLPLATLLASIMTLGNLGENYELLALKAAGVSLPRILKPLIVVVIFVAIGSFFVANNLVPMSTRKMSALIYDVRQQKQSIEFKDGIFFNGIDNMSIRVAHQHPKTRLLTDILIYDNRDYTGNMITTVADSGYISLSDDKRYLLVTLYNGETYESSRTYNSWRENSTLRHHIFEVQNGVIPLSGFDFERTDMTLFNGSQTKNIAELNYGIDSLRKASLNSSEASYQPLLETYLFPHNTSLINDSIPNVVLPQRYDAVEKIPAMELIDKQQLYKVAIQSAKSSRNSYSYDESFSKGSLSELYRYEVEWHRKMSLPVSILIFFLIGAPLGAIIRKGGLGMPIVISVVFFVIYYIISITGEKMAREGTWGALRGMWIASYILFPMAIYLTYKATNDSNLLNSEWYFNQYKRIKSNLSTLAQRVGIGGKTK